MAVGTRFCVGHAHISASWHCHGKGESTATSSEDNADKKAQPPPTNEPSTPSVVTNRSHHLMGNSAAGARITRMREHNEVRAFCCAKAAPEPDVVGSVVWETAPHPPVLESEDCLNGSPPRGISACQQFSSSSSCERRRYLWGLSKKRVCELRTTGSETTHRPP